MHHRKLIYSCVANDVQYVQLLQLLLTSYKQHGRPDDTTDYLVICTKQTQKLVNNMLQRVGVQADVWCVGDQNSLFESACARLNIFKYDKIDRYDRILYLDCDVLVTNNMEHMLSIELHDKLYALLEGTTDGDWWGVEFFGAAHRPTPAFSSGVLMFNNTRSIARLFEQTQAHIKQHTREKRPIPSCLDQPFIVYNAISRDMHNNLRLVNYVINNPEQPTSHTIAHFSGGPGDFSSKIDKMQAHMRKIA